MPPILLQLRKTGPLLCGYDPVLQTSNLIQYHHKEVNAMTARERILAIRLLEKQERNPVYAKQIGIQVSMTKKDLKKMEEKNV